MLIVFFSMRLNVMIGLYFKRHGVEMRGMENFAKGVQEAFSTTP